MNQVSYVKINTVCDTQNNVSRDIFSGFVI